jgi:hypothetical protein
MPFFRKTGIRHLRPNNQEVDVKIQDCIRRIVLLPKLNFNTRFPDGLQENADYLLYQEGCDDFRVGDKVLIDYTNFYKQTDFDEKNKKIIITEVKQPPRLYGTINIGERTGEVYLKSLT